MTLELFLLSWILPMPQIFQKSTRNNRLPAEILIVFIILIVVTIAVFTTINIEEILQRARDSKRLSNLSKLRTALENYKTDHGWSYPTSLSFLTDYISPIPTDPLTKKSYGYTTDNSNTRYELDANLESEKFLPLEKSDGGDNEHLYETGNDLSLIQIGLFNNQGINPPPASFSLLTPYAKDAVLIKETPEGCLFNNKLNWKVAYDPSDKVTYYYYLDNNNNFSSPEITGSTPFTQIEINDYLKNELCEDVGETLNLLIVAQDSSGNLTPTEIYKINVQIQP